VPGSTLPKEKVPVEDDVAAYFVTPPTCRLSVAYAMRVPFCFVTIPVTLYLTELTVTETFADEELSPPVSLTLCLIV
jgi:hypothetical protein